MTAHGDKRGLRVVIADDHQLIRKEIEKILALESDMSVVASVHDGETAVLKAEELKPDVIVMDIRLPGMNGISATRQIKSQNSDISVLCMSVHHEATVVDSCLEAGAAGYILKGNAGTELAPGIRAVVSGERYFCSTIQKECAQAHVRVST